MFFRSSTPDTVSTDFPSTVTTRVLRIILLNWTRDELCIDVEALGCLAEPCEWGGGMCSADIAKHLFVEGEEVKGGEGDERDGKGRGERGKEMRGRGERGKEEEKGGRR